MLTFLTRPYYFEDSLSRRWRTVLLIAAFVFVFLWGFQPFQLSAYPGTKWLLVLGFAAVTLIVCAFFQVLLVQRLPEVFDPERWTTGKEITHLLLMIVFIGLGNTCLSVAMKLVEGFWWGLLYFQIYTFAVSIFPVLFMVLIRERRLSSQYQSLSAELMPASLSAAASVPSDAAIEITASNGKTAIQLAPSAIYYLKSDANYIEIVFGHSQGIERRLFRNTLTAMEQQFRPYDYLFRCHKSYLVNVNRIERLSGNAQGLKIHFAELEDRVPVSRRYHDLLKTRCG